MAAACALAGRVRDWVPIWSPTPHSMGRDGSLGALGAGGVRSRSELRLVGSAAVAGRRTRQDLGLSRTSGIHADAGAHRGGQGYREQIAALGGGRPGANDLVDDRRIVLQQRPLVEARSADRQMDDRLAIGAVLDLS